MRLPALFLLCALLPAAAHAQPAAAARADALPHPSQVSFADMVRLSAAAPRLPGPALEPLRVRLAAAAAEAPLFSVRPVREPARWLLLVSGLALAGWVAHRRLVSPL